MRKGEQDNCLVNHTSESCIIPISKKARHKIKVGSEKAIELFNEILEFTPQDLECQYLLNIAHMTLGQYPQKVKKEFLISPSYFESGQEFPKFEDIAMNLGLDVIGLAGGTCIDDFNNDGYLDILASSWGLTDQIRYFENDQLGGFIDKTNSSGLIGITGGLNLKHADYNNDGLVDFIILRGAWFFSEGQLPNSLIRNNGDGTFTDVTISAGIYSEYPTQTAAWADFDLDGNLDLFIANESTQRIHAPSELFINNGDGTFKNISQDAGLTELGYHKGVACSDVNNDGYPDLYISCIGGDNLLYLNVPQAGKLWFQSIGKRVGVTEPQESFPTWMFDYNNDGFEDIFVSGYSLGSKTASQFMLEGISGQYEQHPYHPYLYRNNGNGDFH